MNQPICSTRTCGTPASVLEPLPVCLGCAIAITRTVTSTALDELVNQNRNRRTSRGSADAEIDQLFRLIEAEGWNSVGLNRAIKVLGAPKATAAKRLAAARRLYADDLNRRTR